MSKMQKEDCQMMGMTWLLANNRTAYFSTVTKVIRAIMMTTDDGSDPQSCSLSSNNGKPMAVASSQLSDQSAASNALHPPYLHLSISSSCFLYMLLLLLLLSPSAVIAQLASVVFIFLYLMMVIFVAQLLCLFVTICPSLLPCSTKMYFFSRFFRLS